jgi:hypothetical protein
VVSAGITTDHGLIMPKRKTNDEPPPVAAPPVVRSALRRWLWQAGALAGIVTLVLGGVIWLGQWTREQLRDQERFQVAFPDIDCQPPPGVARSDFLDEVLYYADGPERFSILEEGLADKLKQRFARHPWVERVDKVEVQPPSTVRVQLTFRQTVLAVVVQTGTAGIGFSDGKKLPVRGVDAKGILLPKKAPLAAGLPVLDKVSGPLGQVGKPWGDVRVEEAARLALLLQPHQQRLQLTWMTWSAQGLVLRGPNVKVVWGDSKAVDVAGDETKLQRLLAEQPWPAPPLPGLMYEMDVRPTQGMQKRVVVVESP